MKNTLLLLVALPILAVSSMLGIYGYSPSRARERTITPSEFSAARAAEHLSAIAREPHPFGSASNRRVADYISSVLMNLGYTPVFMPVSDAGSQRKGVNIRVKIPGIRSAPALLLSAHYDSVPESPGAGDNGAAVAALLETARLLRHSPSLSNDVVLLFTDGEEIGLLGAQAFAASADLVGEIGLVCNFDARGTSGPVIMFETGPGNCAIIDRLASEVPGVIATSLSSFVYQRMPNRTDFSIYRKHGIQGLNFAVIRGANHYHSATDTIDNLDVDTLQHIGEMMWGVSQCFGTDALPPQGAADAIYFNIVGQWLVQYPESWSRGMGLLLVLIATAVMLSAVRCRETTMKAWAILSIVVISAGVLSGGIGFAAFKEAKRSGALISSQGAALTWALCVVFSLTGIAALTVAKRFGVQAVNCAAISVWSSLAVVTIFILPSGSYIFYWPAAVGWLTLAGATWCRALAPVSTTKSAMRRCLLAASSIFAVIFLAPLCLLLWTALPLTLPVICVFASIFIWPLLMSLVADWKTV